MVMPFNTTATGNFTFQPTAQLAAAPTIDSGTEAGKAFDGLGHDFLNPNKILKDVDKFSGSVKPAVSDSWTSQLVPPVLFDRHARSGEILKAANNRINQIMSPGFGQNINFTIPVLANGIPDLGANPDATRITLSTLFFANNLRAPTVINNPNNYNPFLWQNPNSLNILLGVQQAQAHIIGGVSTVPVMNPFLGNFTLLG